MLVVLKRGEKMTKYKQKVRKAILGQTTPFCISDLITRLSQKGLTNKDAILNELDELFDNGMVEFGCIGKRPNKKEIYAFYIK